MPQGEFGANRAGRLVVRDLLIEIVIMAIRPLLSAAAWYWLAVP